MDIPYSPGQAHLEKASKYAQEILAFTGGACPGDYGMHKIHALFYCENMSAKRMFMFF